MKRTRDMVGTGIWACVSPVSAGPSLFTLLRRGSRLLATVLAGIATVRGLMCEMPGIAERVG